MKNKGISKGLRELAAELPKKSQVTLGRLLEHEREHVLASALLLVSIPGLLPSTGIPLGSLFSPLMFVVGVAWMLGRAQVELPKKIRDTKVSSDMAKSILNMMAKCYEKAENVCKVRQTWWVDGPMLRVIGLAAAVNAIIVFLPIPFGNTLPAFANILLAFGVMFRDGVVALAGLALTVVGTVIAIILGWAALWALQQLLT